MAVKLYPECRVVFKDGLRVTQEFGVNKDYYDDFGLAGHEGLDATPLPGQDKTIYTLPFKSKVVKDIDMADKGGAYGIHNTIWYPEIGEAWMYCHLNSNFVFINQELAPSTAIGIMGATGNTNGAHVHINRFKVDANGVRLNKDNGFLGGIDPLPFLLSLSNGNTMPNMYTMPSGKQIDLTNVESMKVVANVYDEVMNLQLYVKKTDVTKQVEDQVKEKTKTLQDRVTQLEKELRERPTIEKPVEVIKEVVVTVPVEVIKEVPKEVIVEKEVIKEVQVPADNLGGLQLISLALKAIVERRW